MQGIVFCHNCRKRMIFSENHKGTFVHTIIKNHKKRKESVVFENLYPLGISEERCPVCDKRCIQWERFRIVRFLRLKALIKRTEIQNQESVGAVG